MLTKFSFLILLAFTPLIINISASESITQKDLLKIFKNDHEFIQFYNAHLSQDLEANKIIKQEMSKPLIEREIQSEEYSQLQVNYLKQSLYQQYRINNDSTSRAPASYNAASKNSIQLKFKTPDQYVGLVIFKKDETLPICQKVINLAKSIGAKGVAFYYPVHYSGGNGKDYSMPATPIAFKHFRYEYAQMPLQKHINDCLDLAVKSKLSISWVPHLESLALIENQNHEEWRMYSGIPIDDHYYQAAFGPLINYLKDTKYKKYLSKNLAITFAAEIDTMVLTHAKESLNQLLKLKSTVAKLNIKAPIYFNTNGDFYHAWEIPQVKKQVECRELGQLINNFDFLAPSMYGDKNHFIIEKNKINLKATISNYQHQFSTKLKLLCPKTSISISSKKIGFGEFALNTKMKDQNYNDFFQQAIKLKIPFVQYWTHSSWDHLGIHSDDHLDTNLLVIKNSKARMPSNQKNK